jgi:hypothetical protein
MDSYLSIAAIANDEFMKERMNACTTQQLQLGNAPLIALDPVNQGAFAALNWVENNRYVWAASPGWGAAWDSALAADNPEPGKDPAVITDAMILSTVQSLTAPPEA